MTKKYRNPALTTDIILFSFEKTEEQEKKDLKVLLIKRKFAPFKDYWAFPGGFVEYDEELETAAKRELEEETGLKGLNLKQLGAFGRVGRDPRGRTVSVVYYVCIDDDSKLNIKAGDDAKEAQWFNIKNLPDLAFDHEEILNTALEKIKTEFPNI